MGALAQPIEFPVLNKVESFRPNEPVPIEMMEEIQRRMMASVNAVMSGGDQTGHMWADGLYCRQFFQPKGQMLVSLKHAKQNFFFILQGECIIGTPEGTMHVRAPYLTVTQPGTKRVILALEDTVYVTVHANPDNVTDLVEIERLYTVEEPGLPRDLSIQTSTRKIFT